MDLREATVEPAIRHPWERARGRFLAREQKRLGGQRPLSVLDVGSGDAWLAGSLRASLPANSTITCWDANYDPARVASLRQLRGSGLAFVAERPSQRFERIWLFDVLEHVENDTAFLADIVRHNLAPGGQVTVTVPAWSRLFSRHDEALGHFRRYEPAVARRLIEGAGLTIDRSGGLFHGLLLPRMLQQTAEQANPAKGPPSDLSVWTHGLVVTQLVDGVLAADNVASATAARLGIDVPGLSWWAACHAP